MTSYNSTQLNGKMEDNMKNDKQKGIGTILKVMNYFENVSLMIGNITFA